MGSVLLILCHPVQRSFNHSLAHAVRAALEWERLEVKYHDLYEEHFDPVLKADELERRFSLEEHVQSYYGELAASDGLVFVHPDWWGQPPALLKGWIDRVLRPGIAYDFEGDDFEPKRKRGLLSGKKACVFCTSDFEGRSTAGHPLVKLWKEYVLGYCGAETTIRVYHPVRTATAVRKAAWISETARTVTRVFPRS